MSNNRAKLELLPLEYPLKIALLRYLMRLGIFIIVTFLSFSFFFGILWFIITLLPILESRKGLAYAGILATSVGLYFFFFLPSATKRIIDIIIPLLGIIVILPLLILIIMAIKIDSPGEVFNKSETIGRNGRIFKRYKFRTTVIGKKGQETTWVGKLLRNTSLDEIPQLINVLKGEMSLVGPYPIPTQLAHLRKRGYRKLLGFTPGIVGLGSIRVDRNFEMIDIDKYDLDYVENWNIWIDIKILIWTVIKVMNGEFGIQKQRIERELIAASSNMSLTTQS